jgi:hypothetical protein
VLQKQMKAERWATKEPGFLRGQPTWGAKHTSRHISPKDGDARDSRKASALSSGRLPAFIQIFHARVRAKFFSKDISIVKKLKERALSLTGKLPAPNKSLELCFEIWERESAPAN